MNSPAPQASVGVVMVNWNGWPDTVQAYRSLLDSDHRGWTLVVVDNASGDASVEQICRQAPTAELIRSPVNLGFAGGCNRGISRVRELGLPYVMLLNNDAQVRPATLSTLVAASARLDDRAVLGAQVLFWPDGRVQFFGSRTSSDRGRPIWYKAAENAALLESELVETDFVFGAALFAPVALFDELGDFDERFFLNFEETDWCYRAKAAGIARYVVPAAAVDHKSGASIGSADGPLQTYFMVRNRLLFARKHASTAQRLRTYAETAKALVLRLAQSRTAASTEAMLLAVRDYALGRFGDCPPRIRQLAAAR